MIMFCRWDPKKRMTPEEAVRHEWLQPSSNSSYNHIKVMQQQHKEANDNNGLSHQQNHQQYQTQSMQPVSIKTQKYFTPPSFVTSRQLLQTQQIILPEVKTPSKHSTNYKLYKDRTKGN